MIQKIRIIAIKILKEVGQFLNTDIKYVVRQGSWLAGAEVLSAILSVGLTVAFANLISPTNFGIYKYILSIYGIFSLFSLSGANTAIVKTVAEGYDAVYKPALKMRLKWSLLGSIGSLFTALYYIYNGNSILGYSLLIAAISLPLFESLNTYQHLLAGKKRFDLQTKYYMLTRIFSAICLVSVLFLSDNIFLILLAYFLPYILGNIIFSFISMKRIELNNNFDPQALTYMKHLSFINIIAFAVNYLDNIIVFQFLGPISLAIYSMASAPVARLQSFFSIIPEISLPKYAEKPIEEIRELIGIKVLKACIFSTLAVVAYVIAVPYLFKWLLPQYQDSVLFAQLLAIPLIWYPTILFSRVFTLKAATKNIYIYNIIESILQLVLTFLMVYFWGLYGAVLSRILVTTAGTALTYYYFKKI